MIRFLARLCRDDSGATAIEYGLIIALVFLAILGALTAFGDATRTLFDGVMTAVQSAIG
jgi:pilus assembly protein Flp/PilA